MGELTTGQSSHTWLAMFASRLLETRPKTSVALSVRCAVSSFHDARDLNPRQAADRYLSACLRLKAMQAAIGQQEPPSSRYLAMFKRPEDLSDR